MQLLFSIIGIQILINPYPSQSGLLDPSSKTKFYLDLAPKQCSMGSVTVSSTWARMGMGLGRIDYIFNTLPLFSISLTNHLILLHFVISSARLLASSPATAAKGAGCKHNFTLARDRNDCDII